MHAGVHMHSCLVLCTQSKKLIFVHIASSMTAIHRDCQVLAANSQWPEIQPLVSQDKIVSADLP